MKIHFTKAAAASSPKRERPETHYHILGVPPASSYEKIHIQYRYLAMLEHPDKGGNEEKFKRIALAWGILRDPERRRKYDAQLLLEGRFSCVSCGGRGLRSGMVGTKFYKDVLCDTCEGKGEI